MYIYINIYIYIYIYIFMYLYINKCIIYNIYYVSAKNSKGHQ